MPVVNPYGYSPTRNQRALVSDFLTEALAYTGEPTLSWELNAEGTSLIGRGPAEAVRLAAGRIGSYELRDQIDGGAKFVTHTVPVYGAEAVIELHITD